MRKSVASRKYEVRVLSRKGAWFAWGQSVVWCLSFSSRCQLYFFCLFRSCASLGALTELTLVLRYTLFQCAHDMIKLGRVRQSNLCYTSLIEAPIPLSLFQR